MDGLLQRCVDIFPAVDYSHGINVYLVITGARPGARLEMEESLEQYAKRRMPNICDELKEIGTEVAIYRRADILEIEFMNLFLNKIRSVPGAEDLTIVSRRQEVYVLSKKVSHLLPIVLMAETDWESPETHRALAEMLGYPKCSLENYVETVEPIQKNWIKVMATPKKEFTKKKRGKLEEFLSLYMLSFNGPEEDRAAVEKLRSDIARSIMGKQFMMSGILFEVCKVVLRKAWKEV